MNRLHGSHGLIKMDPTGGTTAEELASMNAWTLKMDRQKVDVTCFQDPNLVYVIGLPDMQGTLGGVCDTDEQTLFDVAMGDTAAYLELLPTSLVTTMLWKGLAWVDASLDVKANGAVTVTGNFVAAAGWTKLPTPTV